MRICKGTCKDADLIKKAIATVQTAMGGPGQAMLTTAPPFLFRQREGRRHRLSAGVGLINEHKYQEAIDELQRRGRPLEPSPTCLTYLGFANRKLGRYDVAVSYYRQALAQRRTTRARPNIMAN